MSITNGLPTPEQPDEAWRARERLLRRFEQAWAADGPPPDPRAFLPPDPADHAAALVELLALDEEWRRRRLPPPGGPPCRLGKYELLEVAGRGSFGVVWRARDAELGRTVAVKLPRAGALPEAEAERFLREARGAARLSHPNIVAVHDAGRDGDTCYIVTEFVDGPTLAQRLHGGPLEPRAAAELAAALADALHRAHGQGVVHRDVKPSNVLLDAAGRPRLADFGLARVDAGDGTLTATDAVLGTPAYMSPEQARGEAGRVDGRSDVYSLGVVLYEALTGERPFRGGGRALLAQVLEGEPAPPRRLRDLPRDLETVCLRCLEKEPHRRYATAAELADDLRRFLNGEPVRARPLGPFGRLARRARRRPAAAALAAALAAVSLAGASGVLWQWRQAVANFDHAEQQRLRAEENQRQAEAFLDELQGTLQGWTAEDWEFRRRAALEKVIPHYRALLAARPGDELLRAQLLTALLGAGELAYATWDGAAALRHLRDAAEVAEGLLRDHPGDPTQQFRLASAYVPLAWAEESAGLPGWRARAGQAQQMLSGLVGEGAWRGAAAPESVKVAASLHSLLASRGHREAARVVSEVTTRLLQEGLRADPAMPSGRLHLASLHFRAALALYTSNQYARARAIFAEAAALLERACADEPNNIPARLLQARTYSFLGYQERDLGRPGPAADWFERSARAYVEHLLPIGLTPAQFRGDYAGTLHNLALARRRLGDEAAAAAALQRAADELHLAVAFLNDAAPANPGSAQVRLNLVSLLLTLGRVQRERGQLGPALGAFGQARRLSAGDARNLYRVASDLALLAAGTSRPEHAGLALEVLREAVAAGFRDARGLREDEDFARFRERSDFRQLLAELEAANVAGRR